MSGRSSLAGTTVVVLSVLGTAGRASATDPFEIQVYDGTVNAPGAAGVELHVNHVAEGVTLAPPALPTNRVTHFALEPSLGLWPWWEVGAYLQAALRPDGSFDYAGAKLRSKLVTSRGGEATWRLGVNLEASLVPPAYEPDRWGAEVRPIVARESENWLIAVNPILGVALARRGASVGPTFEPAAMLLRHVRGIVDVGIEYYADLGPLEDWHAARDQEHYVYEVFNLLAIAGLELNAGVGEGLTAVSNRLTFKMIAGWTFGVVGRRP